MKQHQSAFSSKLPKLASTIATIFDRAMTEFLDSAIVLMYSEH